MKTAILHNIEETITTATEKLTPSRELSLAITKLQEAYFWLEQTKSKQDTEVLAPCIKWTEEKVS